MRRIYTFLAIGISTILMACATTPTPPAVQVITKEIKVPVPVACVNASDVPNEPEKVGDRLNGQAAHDADLLGSSAIKLRQWGRELKALITPCVKS